MPGWPKVATLASPAKKAVLTTTIRAAGSRGRLTGADAGQTLLDLLALLYVFLRIFYVMMYVADMPMARSAVWAGGFLVNIAILFIGYR